MTSGSREFTAVVDTNRFVSAVISDIGAPRQLIDALRDGKYQLISSAFQIHETAMVFARPRVRASFRLPEDVVHGVVQTVGPETTLVQPATDHPVLADVRDVKDAEIIGAALAGNGDYLVTGDNDLLVLAADPRIGNLRIVTATVFLDALEEPES